MGNECGDGVNFVKGYKMLKALDKSRLVQFEQAGTLPHTDIYCPMYMKGEMMKIMPYRRMHAYLLSNANTPMQWATVLETSRITGI